MHSLREDVAVSISIFEIHMPPTLIFFPYDITASGTRGGMPCGRVGTMRIYTFGRCRTWL